MRSNRTAHVVISLLRSSQHIYHVSPRALCHVLTNQVPLSHSESTHMIVECSRLRRSNIRTEPSAPTDPKMSVPRANARSYTCRHGTAPATTATYTAQLSALVATNAQDAT